MADDDAPAPETAPETETDPALETDPAPETDPTGPALHGEGPGDDDQHEDAVFEGHGEDEWVKSVVADLVLWRHPVLTGLWLVVFLLVFFLVEVSDYSLLTLFSYLVLLQLMATTGAIRSAPTLKSVGLLRPGFDPKVFAQQRQAFTPDELARFSRGSAMIAYEVISYWNDALVTRDARKVLKITAGALALAVAGIALTVDLALLVVVLVAFTVPKLYEEQGDRIDEFVAVVRERVEARVPLDRIQDALVRVADRLEPVLGSL